MEMAASVGNEEGKTGMIDGPTWQLHDPGEEDWPAKIHCPCGDVYLAGYVNCDLAGVIAPGIADHSDPRNYYAGRSVGAPGAVYVDAMADMGNLTVVADPGTVDKILCVQGLEHLRLADARAALSHWHAMLRPGGVVVVTVPDTLDTCERTLITDQAFAIRHLTGTHKNARFVHWVPWTWERLRQEMWAAGSSRVEPYPNPHTYPAIVARAWK